MPDRLVVCLDGTWNSPFQSETRDDGTDVLKPTNPLKLARAVLPTDTNGHRQIVYYNSGMGALGRYPGLSNQLLDFVDTKLGGIWGAGFEANVEQAANFIALNLTPGAELLLFGFSRGAAQARALAKFLDWMGGVPNKADAYYIPIFFRHYLATHGQGAPSEIVNSSNDIISDRLRNVPIVFLGVWDTVMALGARTRAKDGTSVEGRAFHIDDMPPSNVVHARQALAIDKKRYDFRPEIWQGSGSRQTLEQLWFPGAHSNVGGSYVRDGLANCALHWIVNEAKEVGLVVDVPFLSKYRCYPQHEMGDTQSAFWRAREALQFKRGKGVRSLTGHPDSSHLSFHKSVIQRFCANSAEHDWLGKPYRPVEVVEVMSTKRGEWSSYISDFGLDPAAYLFPGGV